MAGVREKNKFKRSILIRWGYSYLIVCIIPLMLFMVFAGVCLSLVNRNISYSNAVAIQFVRREFDTVFAQTNSVCENVLLSTQFQTLNNVSSVGELGPLYLFETTMSLRHLINGYDAIIDCMLYSPDLDLYISGERWGSFNDFYLRNEYNLSYSVERINDIFREDRNVMRIEDASRTLVGGQKQQRLLVLRPLSYARTGNVHNFYAAFLVDVSDLLPSELDDYHDLMIVNAISNEVLFDFTGEYLPGSHVEELASIESGASELKDGKIVTAGRSTMTNVKYLVMVDKGIYFHFLYLILSLAFLSFFLAVIGGLLAVWRRMNKEWSIYQQAIVESGTDVNHDLVPENAYSPFVSSVSRLKEEQVGMSLVIRQQTESLKEHMIAKLVDRSSGPISMEVLYECGINLVSDRFLVLLVVPTEGVPVPLMEERLMSVLCSSRLILLPFTSSHGAAFILNPVVDDEDSSFYASFAVQMKHLLSDDGYGIMNAAASGLSIGLGTLGESYLEANNVIEYQRGISNREFLFHRDVLEMTSQMSFNYTTEHELKLSEAIRSGDAIEAVRIVDKLIIDNRAMGVSPRCLRYLLFSVTGTILRTANKFDDRFSGFLPVISFSPIIQSDNFERSHQEVNNVIERLCEAVLAVERQYEDASGEGYGIYRKALSEIQDGYEDPSLNVSLLADRLSVSIAYLSRVFKKYHNMNISDYITSYRISVSKKLLSEGVLVGDVVSSCGFGSLRTFLRVFKKFEHITPGQYRSMSKEDING